MDFTPGSRLGSYEIVGSLGAGGMGEVYRARDRRLERDVALKVLPHDVSDDPARRARLEREARVLATLNHPHIAAIYGLEESEGVKALVLELVEGPTLADRIKRGPVPVGDAIATARQIAAALDAAHEKGIVHRDLKPANIKVRPDGAVKILDFGIAKILNGSAGDEASEPAVITRTATRADAIVGTAAYMSPEQARGQPVDRRTDIWAFGCVLYEMLTGRAAFARATFTDTLAAVIEQQPDWAALPPATPPAIARLLRRCLEKEPARRLRDIADARLDLDDASESRAEARTLVAPNRGAQWGAIALVGIVIVAIGLFALARFTRDSGAPPQAPVRFAIALQPDEQIPAESGLPRPIAIAPDGRSLLYVTRRPTGNRVYIRRLEEPAATPLAGSEGAIGPFVSPDGRWVGFASGGYLRKVPIGGGASQTITPVSNFMGASWGSDDRIIYAEWTSGLFAVPAAGGTPKQLTTVASERRELAHVFPHVLPGGNAALFAVRSLDNTHALEVADLTSGERRALVEGGNPQYTLSGHIVFTRGSTLYAVPFDLARLQLAGEPVRFSEQARSEAQGRAEAVVSPNGTLAYVAASTNMGKLVLVGKDGTRRPVSDEPQRFGHPRISPDGRRVVVQVLNESVSELWIYDIERGTRLRLRSGGTRPVWTHDGKRITFQRAGGVYSLAADDSNEAELVLTPERPAGLFPLDWSLDGRIFVYSRAAPDTNRDVFTLSADGVRGPFLATTRDERAAMLSPDGRWMVYASLEPGREEEIYVQPFPGPGERLVISQGGREPVWSPAGNEIFYRSIDGQRMMSVEVRTEPQLRVARPRTLFEGRFREGAFWSNYDVTPDGKQFLMLEPSEPLESSLNVVLHWTSTLEQRR